MRLGEAVYPLLSLRQLAPLALVRALWLFGYRSGSPSLQIGDLQQLEPAHCGAFSVRLKPVWPQHCKAT